MQRYLLYICLFISGYCFGQDGLQMGYYANPSLNLYQRSHVPESLLAADADRSYGQGLNLLPGLNIGLWAGKAHHWAIGAEAGVEYLPFSFNLQNYQGMGAVAFPVMLRGYFPLARKQSSAITLSVAGGMQWNRGQLYFQPDRATATPFYTTYVGEVAGGIGAISQKANQIRGVDLYFRFGVGPEASMVFHTGLRVHFWNAVLSTKK